MIKLDNLRPQVFAALYLIAVETAMQAEASSKPLSEVALTAVCKGAKALDQAAGLALDKLQAIADEIKAASEASEYLWLAAIATNNDSEAQIYGAAATAAADCASEATKEITQQLAVGLRAARNGGAAAGAARTFVDLIKGFGNDGATTFCIGNDKGAAGDLDTETACPTLYQERIQKTTSGKNLQMTPTGIKELDGETATDEAVGANGKCHFLQKNGNNVGNLWQDNAPQQLNTAFDLLSLQPGTAGAATARKANIKTKGETEWVIPDATTAAQKAFNDYGQVQKIRNARCGTNKIAVVSNLLGKAPSIEKLKQINKEAKLKPTGQDGDYGTDQIVKEAAGDTKDTEAKLREKLGKVQTTKLGTGSSQPTELSANWATEDIRKSLLFQHISNLNRIADLKRQLSEEKQKKGNEQTQKTAETDRACEKKGTGDNCKDGCKEITENGEKKCVKDPNYKPIQEAGANQDDKTNTTGSNSFVIHKAPLLLAFLLF